ncbi:MAG: DUF3052 domain-containing protein [Streptomycetaceae bacterium]|nr:DUF3052 domain-containing protein [Streptomycetaceae bacterium]
MAGYSGTPLPVKLGIRTGHRVAVVGGELPGGLPPDVERATSLTGPLDVVVLFVTARADLVQALPLVRDAMAPAAGCWVAWPKKAAVKAGRAAPTDMTEDVVRELALPTGLVDNKVCAIDDVWSGLRLVIRRELR